MKKILLFLIIICSFYIVDASFNTYTRTKKNLLVPSDVVVNEENINTIINTPAVDSHNKIYDFADLLTEDEEKTIFTKINEYINNTGIDLVIVTTSNLNSFSINEYAYNFYDYNDFLESGVIFVIYKDGTNTSIFMGNNGPRNSELFTLYTNSRINEILKYVYENDIKNENYYQACESFMKLIDGFYIKTYGYNDYSIRWGMVLIIAFSLTFVIVLSIIMIINNSNRVISNVIDNSLEKNKMIVKCLYDKPLE